MSWAILLVLVLMVGFGVAILPAMRADREDDYHLMHGPDSGCLECEGK
jgi:hypothetical protein